MPRARLTLTIPEGVWIGDVSRGYPDAQFRILAALPGEESGVGLAEVTADDVSGLLSEIEGSDAVTDLAVLQRAENTVLVQFETTLPLLLLPVQGSGVPLEMPFTIEDGRAEWEITAPQRRLSDLGDQLDEFGIPYTVDEVTQHVEPSRLLTDRQLRLVRTAVENGYYDTPRGCTLTELADAVGIAKSTCSETLHRAEENIVKRFVENIDDTAVEFNAP